MYIYFTYPAKWKSTKQLSNCLKIAETNIVLIVFNGVFCELRVYAVTVYFSSLYTNQVLEKH
jgi:hypothetical protein